MLDKNIKILIKILEDSDINELEVSTFWGRQKIRLSKSAPPLDQNIELHKIKQNEISLKEQTIPPVELTTETDHIIVPKSADSQKEEELSVPTDNNITLKAPLVGTYYNSPKPGEPPFISEGEEIKKGQVIGIIEAMKIFNEIESEYSGKIIKILIDDATPVEFDQELIIISPE